MFDEQGPSEWLGGYVSKVVRRWVFDEADGVALFSAADHGVTGGYPFRFVGDAAAACPVDEDAGVSEDSCGAFWVEIEFAKENAEAEDGLGAADGLEELRSAGGVAGVGGQAAGHLNAAAV